jgi:ABC-type nitrate/sulfonate/bicarbonate transport system substrate-binding protein
MSSELAIDQQDVKNQEAVQTMEEQLEKATKEAEDAHMAYFAKRRTDPAHFNLTQEAILWNRYIKAHRAEQDYIWKKMDKDLEENVIGYKEAKDKDAFMDYIIDPNDHIETSERTDPAEVLAVEHRECCGLN